MATKRTVVEKKIPTISHWVSPVLNLNPHTHTHTHGKYIYFKCFLSEFQMGMEEFLLLVFLLPFLYLVFYDVIYMKEKFEKGKPKQQPNVLDNSRQKGGC